MFWVAGFDLIYALQDVEFDRYRDAATGFGFAHVFIGPLVRSSYHAGEFIEVFIDTPLDVCEARDTKGLYRKARAGEIEEFTGITSPYETPEKPALTLDTSLRSIDECVEEVLAMIEPGIRLP
jgi:adenylylsulfate kinase-like enzyme